MSKIAKVVLLFLAFSTSGIAGDLEPAAPPAPTMKTLDENIGAWHRLLPTAERFVLVMNNDEAVLDRETNLVWQRTPGGSYSNNNFYLKAVSCSQQTTGGRYGWRLPTTAELTSLADPTATSAPILPAGHPFIGVGTGGYVTEWIPDSTFANPIDEIRYLFVSFSSGVNVSNTGSGSAWCVRGPK